MPSHAQSLVKRDWKEGHVYLIQFPRAGCLPSCSPYAFKLETWLRLAEIPYTNISNNFTKMSAKGQIPFIELNGRQIADSGIIIQHLIKEFHKEHFDDQLTETEKAHQTAFTALIENDLNWHVIYNRSRDNAWLGGEKGLGGNLSGIKGTAFKALGLKMMKSKIAKACHAQGVGRHAPSEVDEMSERDLRAISALLGDKPFVFGNTPSTLDAVVFGTVAQLYVAPLLSDRIPKFLEKETPNLVAHFNRVKEVAWPDWDEATGVNLKMNTSWQEKFYKANE